MKQVNLNVFYPSKPHAKQQVVLDALDAGERFVLLRAGRKFRKTSLMISWLIEGALQTNLVCPYIAPNKVQARNIAWNDHVQRILLHFKKAGVPYKTNEVELSVTFSGGGKLMLLGVENKEALRGISNWGRVGMDEYDDWHQDIYPKIIRPNLITHKAPVLVTGTPKGFRNLYRLESSGVFKSFHFTSRDNPEIDTKELESLVEEYKLMGMSYYRQEILAEYEKPVGAVYSEWDMDSKYIPFEYDPNLPLHLTWDFGINDPTAIIFIQPNGSELRVIDYYEAANANLEHFAQVLAAKPYKLPELETGDIAGRARELTTGKSPIEELKRMGHNIKTDSIPDLPTQIRNTHKFIPRLFVSSSVPDCARVRECLVNYRYPKKESNIINQSNEIPIHDEYSHCMRAFEYYCWNYKAPESSDKTVIRNNEMMAKWSI